MFQRNTLQTRLFGAFLFLGLIVLIVAFIGWSGNSRLTGHLNTINQKTFPSALELLRIDSGRSKIQAIERSQLSGRLTLDNRRNLLNSYREVRTALENATQRYRQIPRDDEEERLYQEFNRVYQEWQRSSDRFQQLNADFENFGEINPFSAQANLLAQENPSPQAVANARQAGQLLDEMVAYTFRDKEPTFRALEETLGRLIAYNQQRADLVNQQADDDVSRTTFWVLLGMLIGPLTAILFGLYFSATIARPLGKKIVSVVEVAENISSGDLTRQVPVTDTQDEIGKLMMAFYHMTQSLNSLIRQVQQSGIQITTSTTQIAASGKELEAAITEQVASTNQVVATAREIATNSEQLAQTMDEVTALSQSTAGAATNGQQDLIRMQNTMRQLVEATGSISNKLGVISEKANNINSIVTTITKVADQTNLLSLNAAIEAEKAREYGLGFAVVAREIRRLADQTAVATLDIESMVKEMQSAVSTGVMEMDKFTKEVGRGVEDVGSIGQQLGQIIEQVQSLNPRFASVNEGMEAQSLGAQQISDAMLQLREASVQTAEALRETNRAIDQLNDAAQKLRLETSRFKVN
ncbi:methyl-accepting chemotaxis protein [Desertifilum sp. FACHB-1129]|uniref:Chemotaxis protein n=1 Tax=Desertifilum tharense IPPAS B-1220 TaxID=1781255 RepID=A0A1E5QHS5_9CYAN|nr:MULTISPECIES: methyl-accepting chemotaxis protein [Desertifilum]MDA0211372.1 methyl-accepting chemotaxis protein [Cyanobacteria bacterium FC1]MBD2314007.1 methyl-accepting chemotaxis protein [Desertifilum sp. FACHB-1129]MBD2320333.1 methyl-accepting chemotaxis protein [Desertifilum sp. FACHB-866]MBD2330461.1 methyl-accepting chemotaxis protein [Desertifilum sp. FACHB-868]OEJ74229.1 chemotaxis protein [Desertifilum tharense IPPAS B-1220]